MDPSFSPVFPEPPGGSGPCSMLPLSVSPWCHVLVLVQWLSRLPNFSSGWTSVVQRPRAVRTLAGSTRLHTTPCRRQSRHRALSRVFSDFVSCFRMQLAANSSSTRPAVTRLPRIAPNVSPTANPARTPSRACLLRQTRAAAPFERLSHRSLAPFV
jgi:hypothetical protein